MKSTTIFWCPNLQTTLFTQSLTEGFITNKNKWNKLYKFGHTILLENKIRENINLPNLWIDFKLKNTDQKEASNLITRGWGVHFQSIIWWPYYSDENDVPIPPIHEWTQPG